MFSPTRTRGGLTTARSAWSKESRNWDSLVTSFPNHRVVHRRCWAESIQASTGARAVFLVFERHGEVVGCLPGLIRRVGPLRLFGSPLVGWQTCSMGPAFDTRRVTTGELMSSVITLLEGRFGVHHIELISGELDDAAMRDLGFRAESIPTLRAPLNPGDPGRTLKQLRDSARRNVRRAERLGLVARAETDETFVDDAYEQMKEVFVRGGNVVPFTHRSSARILSPHEGSKHAARRLGLSSEQRYPDSNRAVHDRRTGALSLAVGAPHQLPLVPSDGVDDVGRDEDGHGCRLHDVRFDGAWRLQGKVRRPAGPESVPLGSQPVSMDDSRPRCRGKQLPVTAVGEGQVVAKCLGLVEAREGRVTGGPNDARRRPGGTR